MNIMIFLLGGCAGWAVRSVFAYYKKRKMMDDISKIISNVTDVVNELANKLESDEDTEIKVVDIEHE